MKITSHHQLSFIQFSDPPDWTEILAYFRGSELQNYFTKILEDDLKAVMKPQYVDQIPRAIKGSVQSLLDKKNEMDNQVRVPVINSDNSGHNRDLATYKTKPVKT